MKIRNYVKAVIVTCDRCGATVAGTRTDFELAGESPITTTGFYENSPYADKGERILCEPCVWADPGYLADYGYVPQDLDEHKAVLERQLREDKRREREKALIESARAAHVHSS